MSINRNKYIHFCLYNHSTHHCNIFNEWQIFSIGNEGGVTCQSRVYCIFSMLRRHHAESRNTKRRPPRHRRVHTRRTYKHNLIAQNKMCPALWLHIVCIYAQLRHLIAHRTLRNLWYLNQEILWESIITFTYENQI